MLSNPLSVSSKPVRHTLTGFFEFAEEIKRSRFFARAAPAASPEEATTWIETHRNPEATHNAWAWVVGATFRFQDDGEVSGTAGKPILGAIEKQGLDRVVVLVSRIYGGVKLGTGGLVRAYGGTAASCLRLAPRRELRQVLNCRFRIPFSEQGRVFHLLEKFQIERRGETFLSEGVEFEIRLSPPTHEPFRSALADVLRGADAAWVQHSEELL